MQSYSHSEQHAPCTYSWLRLTKRCPKAQAKPLIEELEGQGYDISVMENISDINIPKFMEEAYKRGLSEGGACRGIARQAYLWGGAQLKYTAENGAIFSPSELLSRMIKIHSPAILWAMNEMAWNPYKDDILHAVWSQCVEAATATEEAARRIFSIT